MVKKISDSAVEELWDGAQLSSGEREGGRAASLISGGFKAHTGGQQGCGGAPCISSKQASTSVGRQHDPGNFKLQMAGQDQVANDVEF